MKVKTTYPELVIKTFLTWEMPDQDGSAIRAIALVDDRGWYHAGLNTMMDSQMGEKDEDGIYENIWMEDEVPLQAIHTVRNATKREIEIYLKHCPHLEYDIKEQDGSYHKFVGIVARETLTEVVYERVHKVEFEFEYEKKC